MGQKDKISHFITDYYKKHNIFQCKRQTRVDMLVPTKKPVDW